MLYRSNCSDVMYKVWYFLWWLHSRCLANREGPLGSWPSENHRSPCFVLATQQPYLSNGTFTHRQPQTHQVLCNYHLSSLRVVAECAFYQMKGTRKAFAVKLEISLWFLNKNLLPCCRHWQQGKHMAANDEKKSQGRTMAIQAYCSVSTCSKE